MKRIKDNLLSLSFVAPLVIIYAFFVLLPILSLFYLSFFKGKIYSQRIDQFIGFKNYLGLFNDPYIAQVLKNTFIYAFSVALILVTVGLLLALFLYKNTIINKIVRTCIFVPVAISGIAASLIWKNIYNPRYGLLNNFLEFLHLDFLTASWLGNPKTAMVSILALNVWQASGFSIILLIAGIQSIPKSVFDAGRIDGTNKFTENIYIVIPLIKKVILTVVLFILTDAFKVFEYIFATTQGGPMGSTQVLGTYLYEVGFKRMDITYAITLSVVLFFITLIFTIIFLYTTRYTREG